MILSSQPSAPGFNLRLGCAYVIQYTGTWKEMHKACITVRVGAAMPACGDSNYIAATF